MHLFHKVPRYMIPHYMVSVDSLPLAGTGKVNVKLLPSPQPSDLLSGAVSAQDGLQNGDGNSEGADSKPGETKLSSDILPLARDIAAIFSEALGRRCSVHDDFFFSGGHSILAARAVQMMRARLGGGGLAVPFTAILAHPTPAALAARLVDMRRWRDQGGDLPAPLVLLRPATAASLSKEEDGGGFEERREGQKQSLPMDIVVMHPIGGGLMPMAGLADALGERLRGEARIIGLPWTSTSGGGGGNRRGELASTRREEDGEEISSPQTVEALAERYAEILADFISARSRGEAHDSDRPLYLLGWSFGGTLAYEAAKRLQSMRVAQGRGEESSVQVVLLDAPTLDAAVRELEPCSLVAENYAEHMVDYIAERTRSSSATASSPELKRSTAQGQGQSDQIQSLRRLLRHSRFDEHTNLSALAPLVRECYDKSLGIPSWITDADLVESSRGLQANLQALCGSSHARRSGGHGEGGRQKGAALIADGGRARLAVLHVQATRGLGARLPDADLGWEAERRLQAGRLVWTKHEVETGHDDVLVSAVDLVADHISTTVGMNQD
ncbi:hypothetical protein CDD83_7645 [Cordyceps sp. RAO-2017]|nr:hypothetical protein CDD83_7645 [Cordyceps sp. RAO-2017]